jgi:hypothetical protein
LGNTIEDDAPPLASTRRKLREAAFFLRHLNSANNEILLHETRSEASEFFLSAFLSAGRSVGDYMETEGGDDYRVWWAQRETSEDQLDLLGFTREQRKNSVHIRGPQIERSEEWVPVVELQREMALKGGSYVNFSSAPQAAHGAKVWRPVIRFTHFPERPVVDVCRDYLELMNTVVNEYEAHLRAPRG